MSSPICLSGLQEFQNEKFRGRYLTVSVARENFMEKLKREREESTQSPGSNTKTDVTTNADVTSNPFRLNIEKKSKVIQAFDSDDDDEEESNRSLTSPSNATAEPESVVKRKSKLFTENGKVNGATNSLAPQRHNFLKLFSD